MMEKVATKLCQGTDDEILQAKVLYGLRIVFSEASKFILLLLIFIVLHMTRYYFFSFVVFFSVRLLAGGIHLDTSLKCFLLSVLFFLTTVFSAYIPKLNLYVYIAVALISLCIVALKAPVPSKNRTLKIAKLRHVLKVLSIITIAIWLVFLLVYIKDVYLLNCGIATIFLSSIQLINIKKEV